LILAHRAGWHFDLVNDSEPLWSLGAFGSSLLNIYVDNSGAFSCFDYLQDAGERLTTVTEVENWLATREAIGLDLSTPSMELL